MNQHPEENAPAAQQPVEELFLLHLRYKESRLVEAGNNRPVTLDDPGVSWVVYKGTADLFAVPVEGSDIAGSRLHLFRLHAGEAAFGFDAAVRQANVTFILVGSSGTRLLKLDTGRLQALTADDEFGAQVSALVDGWVRNMSATIIDRLPPKTCLRLDGDAPVALGKGESACSRQGILWVRHLEGHSHFADLTGGPRLNGQLRWPVTERSWIESDATSRLDLIGTRPILLANPRWPDLAYFNEVMVGYLVARLQAVAARDRDALRLRDDTSRTLLDTALRNLMRPLQSAAPPAPAATADQSPLVAAFSRVAAALGVDVTLPPPGVEVTLENIARASRLQVRHVALDGSWWRRDNGPLLGRLDGSEQPVALLREKGRYSIHDPQSEAVTAVDAGNAATLNPVATMIYRPLPASRISLPALLRFGARESARDRYWIVLMGLATGLLGLVVPVMTGFIIDQIIPERHVPRLLEMTLLLGVVAVAIALFTIVQNLAILRLQSRMTAKLQAAIWDRVLNLPVAFFRDFTAGDLGNRVMGVTQAQQLLSGTLLSGILAAVFSSVSFLLLYYYDRRLALVAAVLVTITLAVTLYLGRRQLRFQRDILAQNGKLTGIILEAIEGIGKFRAAGAEGRAFSEWSRSFSHLKGTAVQSRAITTNLNTFVSFMEVAALLVIFSAIYTNRQFSLTTGQFLAFNAAFLQLFTGVLLLSMAIISVLSIVPLLERSQPLLDTLPELDAIKLHPGSLQGNLEASAITFRYDPDGPPNLDDVSVEINAGEFIALVGPSGSGKSTLFRILLGFEQAEAGAVYYDGQELSMLDIREVRRQIGVVLQNGAIMPGEIYTNIIGSLPLGLDDAWEAAELAGLAGDIRAMPMGMNTVVAQGGGTLSGGQRQRLLIARAIVNRPRILFFDEATSALDSQTQAIVSQSLEALQATRIVIAHRLSTIRNADRIYVLDQGRLVQQGTYEALMKQEGLFATLARRQIA